MEWVRLDVDFFRHPRTGTLTPQAQILFLAGLTWAGEHETSWVIPTKMGRQMGSRKAITELVDGGLWEPIEGGWHIRDAEDRQPDLAELRRKRAESGRKGAQQRWGSDGKCHSKPMASAIASAIANSWQTDGTSTSTSLEPSLTLLKETHEDIHSPVDEEEDRKAEAALRILASKRLSDRRADADLNQKLGPIRDPAAWLREATERLRGWHAEALQKLDLPSMTVEQIVEALDPPPERPKSVYDHFPNWTKGATA